MSQAVTKVTSKNFIGHFFTADAKHYVGDLCVTPSKTYVIVGQRPFGNGEVEWSSAEFKASDIKKIGAFGGIREYTAR